MTREGYDVGFKEGFVEGYAWAAQGEYSLTVETAREWGEDAWKQWVVPLASSQPGVDSEADPL